MIALAPKNTNDLDGAEDLTIRRRRVVEPTDGLTNHCTRVDRHHDTTLTAHEGFLYPSQTALPLPRLDHSRLFDTQGVVWR
ncbi:MAG: hypothetical protein SV966_01920 [Actinomycetota bacterium]|nr:hypothetical protein [Actinomycetota bacterium]